MDSIILEICEEFINNVVGYFGDGQIKRLESIETELKEKVLNFCLR